jgi:YVTN family beta-propeller protein
VRHLRFLSLISLLAFAALVGATGSDEDDDRRGAFIAPTTLLPTGQRISPTSAKGARFQNLNPHLADFPNHVASHAVSTALSPDSKTLLILTSGFNVVDDPDGKKNLDASNEYVFIWDVSTAKAVQKQVLQVPNTFVGIAFSPDGGEFYVAGGKDDAVHTYRYGAGRWSESGETIKLNHEGGIGSKSAVAAGVAVSRDGKRVVVANFHNDSASIVALATRSVTSEVDLRPGKADKEAAGTPGGEYPYGVAIKGNTTAYISSQRDREIVVLDIDTAAPRVVKRIKLEGNPNKMILNKDQTLLFIAEDNADAVTIIDTATDRVRTTIRSAGPDSLLGERRYYRGSAPNGLALSADEKRLFVTNGGTNSVAVIALDHRNEQVIGLIPTGWYPNDVAVGPTRLFVVNGKSIPGPNPGHCLEHHDECVSRSAAKRVPNSYVLQLQRAGLLTLPIPEARELRRLTRQVVANNGIKNQANRRDARVMQALRERIRHVIYVVKENRTYDQVLGDLPKGNGDPSLVQFGRAITPNQHALASNFVTLDNFLDSGEVSGNGWPWSTSGRETDIGVKTIPPSYAGRGLGYDVEGTNRGVNVSLATVEQRKAADPDASTDPDLLPGTNDVAAPDGPDGQRQEGYIWDAALRAGLTVRNYGFLCDLARYNPKHSQPIPLERMPFRSDTVVAYPANRSLAGVTDPYFRCYDNAFPDFYREQEWEREFGLAAQNNDLPALSLVRFMHDHTGRFGDAIDGVNTPETQVADNDYAVGKLVEAVANSPYKDDTLIFIVEDDAQDGPDHVDAQRSIAFVVGPYVKHGAVIHKRYTTVNLLRTIEDVLGTEHMSVYDAHQEPMTEIFDLAAKDWAYKATVSPILASTSLPVAASAPRTSLPVQPTHDGQYWESKTAGMNFMTEDQVDAPTYNRILWEGIKTGQPYPARRLGTDLSKNRKNLLRSIPDEH